MGRGLAADIEMARGDFRMRMQFDVDAGVTGVFGPSGAGKSSLLQAVAGTLRPDRGRIEIEGRPAFDAAASVFVAPERRGIGYAFQSDRLFPHLSVSENVLFGRRLRPSASAFDCDEVVARLELEPLMNRRVAKLSGGERRRVGLARAFLAAERLLLLDEPMSGLDDRLATSVLDLLRRARDEQGLSMLYVSHSMWEIQELTDRMIVVEDGRVSASGPAFEVLRDPGVFALASKLGLENLLSVEIAGHDGDRSVTKGRIGDREWILPLCDHEVGKTARISIRPSDILLAKEEVTGTSARNCVRGVVDSVTEVGDRFLVNVDVGQPLRVEVTRASAAELDVRPGADVHLLLKTYAFTWRPG
jgi:molybdate transport system ATP-binding protein